MASMGLRFSEAYRIGPDNYDADTKTIRVQTKGGKVRPFPVPDEVSKLIALCPPDNPGTYIEKLNGGPIKKQSLRKRWRTLKKKAGVRDELNPHDLRRTAAVRVYTLTKDVLAVKALLGHEDITSTATYLAPYEPAAMRALQTTFHRWTPKGGSVQ